MNNEKEIKKLARLICQDENGKCLHDESACNSHIECWASNKAQRLLDSGIGDKKQAVKEFAEKKVKPLINELVELMFNDYESYCKVENCEKPDDIPCGCSICVEENKQLWESKIDDFITELYGDDKNEN